MADAEQPETVKVTYIGDNPIPCGVLSGGTPEKDRTYEICGSWWEELKAGSIDWKEAKAPSKKKAKKKPSTKKSSND